MIFNSFLFSFVLAAETRRADLPEFVSWLAIPATVIGFVVLLITILKLVKMFGDARICRVPLAESSEVEISATGKLNLSFEAPIFTVPPSRGLKYELTNKNNGQAVELSPTAASLMSRNNGATTTFPVRVFQTTETGKYLLKVLGFRPETDYSRNFLIIERPTALKTVFYSFGIILSGLMFIGGFIFTMIIFGAKQ